MAYLSSIAMSTSLTNPREDSAQSNVSIAPYSICIYAHVYRYIHIYICIHCVCVRVCVWEREILHACTHMSIASCSKAVPLGLNLGLFHHYIRSLSLVCLGYNLGLFLTLY